jgi:hypothetical protein
MEQVLINISDKKSGNNLKAYLEKQNGLEFKFFADLKTRKFNQIREIMALSDAAQNENSGIEWEDVKQIIRSK